MAIDEKQRAADLAVRIHALSHSVRLRALRTLVARPENTVNVTELTEIIGYPSQGSLSDHLRRLCDAGFLERHTVRSVKGGAYHYYRVDRTAIEAALRELWSYVTPEAAPSAAS